jgi:hypothetical protein
MPHLPSAASALFTGPEIRSASVIAAIGRRIITATVRRTPIWPASAEWYSWFASKRSQTPKQIRPTAIMWPADARRLWSVGSPSVCERVWVLGARARVADGVRAGRARRVRAEVPERRVEALDDLFELVRALRTSLRWSPLRPPCRRDGFGDFRNIVK